jgi:PAS domain S-box-containing protein
MNTNEKLLEATKRLSFLELPIGVYVVTPEGQIIEANKQARLLFQLPLTGTIDKSILDFYQNPNDRDGLAQALESRERRGQFLISKLTFKIGNRVVYVQDIARSIPDPDTGDPLGYLCCLMNVTSEVRYHKLFDEIPVGVYILDREDKFKWVNDAFLKLFGYDSQAEVVGRSIKSFYFYPEEAQEFRRSLEKEGARSDHVVQVLKKDGDSMFVRVSTTKVTSPTTGEYDGREGTVMEAAQERYRNILEIAPIGLYMVEHKDGEDRLVDCNDQFVAINEFDNKDEAKNFDMKRLHSSPEEYNQFVKKLEESRDSGKPLSDQEVKIRTVKKNEKTVRVSVSAIEHPFTKKIIGRIGVVRDVTELKHKVDELTDDIGNVLHSYSAALVEIKQSVDTLLETIRINPNDAAIGQQPDKFIRELERPTKQLAQKLQQLLSYVNMEERKSPFLMEKKDDIVRLLNLFENLTTEVPYPKHQPSALHEATSQLVAICEEIKGEKLPNQLVKQIKMHGQEFIRTLNIFTLYKLQDLAFALGPPVRALREFVITGVRTKEKKTVTGVLMLINSAIDSVNGFARIRGVPIKKQIECLDATVEVIERDMVRALSNILHNAIKYSWTRTDNPTWVKVHLRLVKDMVHFEFENYGVPIPKDEINELIFKLGFRGRYSSDRNRIGTGVGLADASRVAQQHGGNVSAKSYPATQGRRDDNYNQPFLTTVTLTLPVYIRR